MGNLFGLYSFFHQSCATGTLILQKEIYPQKSLPNLRQLIFCRLLTAQTYEKIRNIRYICADGSKQDNISLLLLVGVYHSIRPLGCAARASLQRDGREPHPSFPALRGAQHLRTERHGSLTGTGRLLLAVPRSCPDPHGGCPSSFRETAF